MPSAPQGVSAQRQATGVASARMPLVGDRLPAPPRERRPALAALAVFLILAGALVSTMLVLQSGDRVSVVMIHKMVSAGGRISSSDITEARVAQDGGIDYVPWRQRTMLDRYHARTDLVPGTLLIGSMLTDGPTVHAGQVVVGLSLKSGQYPVGLAKGDHVALYYVGTSGRTASRSTFGQPLVDSAWIDTIPSGKNDEFSSGDAQFSVFVAQENAAVLAQAAAAGNVAVVKLGSSGS